MKIKRWFLMVFCTMASMWMYGQTLVNGIFYNFSDYDDAEVTYGSLWNEDNNPEYAGHVFIPDMVDYNGYKYVTGIGDQAFRGCSDLTGIDISNSITRIGVQAFQDCRSLQYILIPPSVINIGSDAFAGCSNLNYIDVVMWNEFYSSEDGVLFDKNKTTLILCPAGKTGNYVIPEGVRNIESGAFTYCRDLTSVVVPSSVESIGNSAFSVCSNLASIIISNGVKRIEEWAFSDCQNLTSITIPASVTNIGFWAFANNSTYINVEEGNEYYSSEDGVLFDKNKTFLIRCPNTKTGSYVIPGSVTSIDRNAFQNCSRLTSITIPASVSEMSFSDCGGLTSIINLNPVPVTVNSDAFWGVKKNTCILYVPAGSKEDYKDTDVWKDFINIVEFPDISVLLSENGAIFTWKPVEHAEGYLLKIFADEEHTDLIRTLEFDAAGQFVRELRAGDAVPAFTCTLENLSSGTTYYYTLETLAANNVVLLSQSGEFTTLGEMTGIAGVKNISPAKITGYYSVLGVKLPEEPENGIYIVTYDDGTAGKKVKK